MICIRNRNRGVVCYSEVDRYMARRIGTILFRLIPTLVVLGVAAVVFLTLAGPIDNRGSIKPAFDQFRAQWESMHITHYRATIHTGPLIFCEYRVEVENNRVIQQDISSFPSEDYCKNPWTVDVVIDEVAKIVDRGIYSDTNVNVNIEYDQSYGFPKLASFTSQMSDMPIYKITDFKVIIP
jgi:hypothetical protein